jgi:hypothetical protein
MHLEEFRGRVASDDSELAALARTLAFSHCRVTDGKMRFQDTTPTRSESELVRE